MVKQTEKSPSGLAQVVKQWKGLWAAPSSSHPQNLPAKESKGHYIKD